MGTSFLPFLENFTGVGEEEEVEMEVEEVEEVEKVLTIPSFSTRFRSALQLMKLPKLLTKCLSIQ